MNKTFISVLKKSSLIFFWFIFPPLFLVFSIIWKSPKLVGRIILTIVAPLTLLTLIVGFLWVREYYSYNFKRGNRSEIEAKTGLKFPDYQIIEKRHSKFGMGMAFNSDYSRVYSVKLDTTDIQEFYDLIEGQIKIYEEQKGENEFIYWSKNQDGSYFFNHFDFNDSDDQTLQITIDKKSSIAEIEYGRM